MNFDRETIRLRKEGEWRTRIWIRADGFRCNPLALRYSNTYVRRSSSAWGQVTRDIEAVTFDRGRYATAVANARLSDADVLDHARSPEAAAGGRRSQKALDAIRARTASVPARPEQRRWRLGQRHPKVRLHIVLWPRISGLLIEILGNPDDDPEAATAVIACPLEVLQSFLVSESRPPGFRVDRNIIIDELLPSRKRRSCQRMTTTALPSGVRADQLHLGLAGTVP